MLVENKIVAVFKDSSEELVITVHASDTLRIGCKEFSLYLLLSKREVQLYFNNTTIPFDDYLEVTGKLINAEGLAAEIFWLYDDLVRILVDIIKTP